MKLRYFLASCLTLLSLTISSAHAALPKGFVYLADIDPTIIQSMRYYSGENFTGRKVDGYKAPKVILTIEAATALKAVQDDLRKDGYSLVVYDSYRPQKAVQHFLKWSEDPTDQTNKEKFYPYVDKPKCFELGYIVEKSGHTRGSTVDLSIIKLGDKVNDHPKMIKRKLVDGRLVPYLDDNTVDMYTSWDLFDSASHHDTQLISKEYLDRRNYLRAKMKAHNFQEYSSEWWHYTLVDEPYKDQYFDFDIE